MPKLYYKSGSSWVNALNIFYPVGAFYISNVSTSPATLLGGTWAQVTNAAIRGATSAGYTGSDTTTLTISQIPKHRHIDHSRVWWSNYTGNGFALSNSSSANLQVDSTTVYTDYAGGGGAYQHSALLQLLRLVPHCLKGGGANGFCRNY